MVNNILRVPESNVLEVPNIDMRKNKILAFDGDGNPISVLAETGSATDVILELAKRTGGNNIGLNYGTVTNAINYYTPEMFGAISGTDCTDALIKMTNTVGEGAVIYYGGSDKEYFISNGVIPLFSGQSHIALGAKIKRIGVYNTGPIFLGDSVSDIIIDGLSITNSTSLNLSGATAACIRAICCEKIKLSNLYCTGGHSGIQLYGCDRVILYKSTITGNLLSGISGIVKRLELRNSRIQANGYPSDGGQTHEVYVINSPYGYVEDCDIGYNNGNDGSGSYSLFIKNKTSEKTYSGFDNCDGWIVKNNRFSNDRGLAFTNDSSSGEGQLNQIPQRMHIVINNSFSNGSGLRIASSENCIFGSNSGDEGSIFAITDASTYPGYTPGLVSYRNTFGKYQHSVISNQTKNINDILHTDCIALSKDVAIDVVPSFGGVPRGTFVGFTAPNVQSPLSPAVYNSWVKGEVVIKGSESLKLLSCAKFSRGSTSISQTPEVNKNDDYIHVFDVYSKPHPVTINATAAVKDGASLKILLIQTAGSGVSNVPVIFDLSYRLTAQTKLLLTTNSNGQRLYLEFLRYGGMWIQKWDSSWG